jgi:sporulation protein YlmC with PRC-barrel domain
MSEHRWVALDLLDRQIIDDSQQPVGKVDDVDFNSDSAGSTPQLMSLLSGAEALGQRLGGVVGTAMAGGAHRMLGDPRDGSRSVSWSQVAELGYVIKLRHSAAELGVEPALEVWTRDNVIGPLPGSGRHASR